MFRRVKKDKYLPTTPTVYPSNLCVKTSKSYWYLKGTNRLKISSDRVLKSWAFARIVETTEEALANYINVGTLGFRDGTLIQSMKAEVYYVEAGKKRPVENPDWLRLLDTDFAEIMVVSEDELRLHQNGEVLG